MAISTAFVVTSNFNSSGVFTVSQLSIVITTFVLIGWIISLCLHEFSHALVAYWGGDTTVKDKGYLTLNPLKYTDPLMSIILPLVFL